VPVLLSHLPRAWKAYHEPCLGGGALFFALHGRYEVAYLSDVNSDLLSAYLAVRDRPEHLLQELAGIPVTPEAFEKMRRVDADRLNHLARAARTLYLGRCCFNGLWRTNAAGRFNAPWGKYKAPLAPVPRLVRAASPALQRTILRAQDFEASLRLAGPGDLAYLDPPYDGTFAAYTKGKFTQEDQRRLATAARAAAARGVLVMVSNSATPLIRTLYAGWRFVRVTAPRSISCKSSTRTQEEPELLLLSWR